MANHGGLHDVANHPAIANGLVPFVEITILRGETGGKIVKRIGS